MAKCLVGILGATGLVGECLLTNLTQSSWPVVAYSRRPSAYATKGVETHKLPPEPGLQTRAQKPLPYWICVAPIWVLPEYFELLEACNAKLVVALSSTSRFTKENSSDLAERATTHRLAEAETRLQSWAENSGVEWVILRTTLVYGLGRDKNIAEIARFVRCFKFFPFLGTASGMRQPIHVQDLVGACVAVLQKPGVTTNRAYNLSGGESLSYREMVGRVFVAVGLRVRSLTVPLFAFRLVIALLRHLPRYRHWSPAMAERMNSDMVFDHSDALREFDFKPRVFKLSAEDVAA